MDVYDQQSVTFSPQLSVVVLSASPVRRDSGRTRTRQRGSQTSKEGLAMANMSSEDVLCDDLENILAGSNCSIDFDLDQM